MSVSVCGTCFADSSLLIYHSRHFFRLFCFLDGICCKSILVSGIRVTIRAAAVRLFVTYSSYSWHYSQVTIDWNYWYWCQCEIRVELLVLLINTVKMICASEENAFCQWRLEILQNQYLKTFPWRCWQSPRSLASRSITVSLMCESWQSPSSLASQSFTDSFPCESWQSPQLFGQLVFCVKADSHLSSLAS